LGFLLGFALEFFHPLAGCCWVGTERANRDGGGSWAAFCCFFCRNEAGVELLLKALEIGFEGVPLPVGVAHGLGCGGQALFELEDFLLEFAAVLRGLDLVGAESADFFPGFGELRFEGVGFFLGAFDGFRGSVVGGVEGLPGFLGLGEVAACFCLGGIQLLAELVDDFRAGQGAAGFFELVEGLGEGLVFPLDLLQIPLQAAGFAGFLGALLGGTLDEGFGGFVAETPADEKKDGGGYEESEKNVLGHTNEKKTTEAN